MSLKKIQKTALVTGGASGLGKAMAKTFADAGIFTIIAGRNEEKLQKATKEIGKNSAYEVLDINNLSLLPEFVNNVVKFYGKLDILVNNAGIHLKKDALETTDEEFQSVIQTNQNAVFTLSREVAKHMKINEKGAILNISSMASQYGIPKVIAYSASKTAVEGMTRALAAEWSPYGIRVNCIAPGFIYSEMTASALDSDPERKNKVFSRTPMKRMGQPEEIASAALFLVSDAASYITGVVLPVDGGNSIGF